MMNGQRGCIIMLISVTVSTRHVPDAMRCDAITTRNKTPLPTHQNIHFNKMHH